MKLRIISILGAAMIGVGAMAQDFYDSDAVIFDAKEDSTTSTSIADIINIRMQTDYNHQYVEHTKIVWKRKTFFDMNYINSTLRAVSALPVAYEGTSPSGQELTVPEGTEFKSDWGVGIKWGHNFNLHKKAIGNALMFNLDYTWIDLAATHYQSMPDASIQFDPNYDIISNYSSNIKKTYIPWELEKYSLHYNMLLGPSLTLAPFTALKNFNLDFVKLNVYFHMGYGINVMFMPKQAHPGAPHFADDTKTDLDVAFGHGFITSFGASLNWKAIGLGIERTKQTYKYSSSESIINSGDRLKNTSTRIFIQFRL